MEFDNCFECPQTRTPLAQSDGHLVNPDSTRRYRIINGVPLFLKYSSAAKALDGPLELVRMNALAPVVGWKSAMEEVYGVGSAMMDYSANPQRAKFLNVIDLRDSTAALEVGIGFGQQTVEIAQRVGSLHAIDVVLQNAVFARQRCSEERINNAIVCCGGDDDLLPYPDNRFDVVIMNLVFEWAASRNLDNPGAAGQMILLREANRVLKAGGVLYLNTKNRYALRLLLGKRDEHAYEMRFGHALPQVLMNALLSIKGHKGSSGTLHSHTRLKHMLLMAGFSIQDSFWAIPEMRYPTHFIKTKTAEIKQFRKQKEVPQGEYRSTRLFMPLIPAFLVKHFTPGLMFLCRKK